MSTWNPLVPWREIAEQLAPTRPPGDGSDSPAWSRKRRPYEDRRAAPPPPRPTDRVPYAELHCHSNFSFLDGAGHPEELAEEAARLGLDALALTDHDGVYGVVRFAEAADALGLPTIFGAELNLSLTQPRAGQADPDGTHLVVLARDPDGYGRLCRSISAAHLAGGTKGLPRHDLDALADAHDGHWLVLTGCRKGPLTRALDDPHGGAAAAARALDDLVGRFGADNVAVELWDHGLPTDTDRNDALAHLAAARGVPTVATNNVHYPTPARWPLANALAAVRSRRSLDAMAGRLPPSPAACLRSGAEQRRRFARWPGAVDRAAAFGRDCAFRLSLVAPSLPAFPVPDGHDEMSFLRSLAEDGARRRYGTRDAGTVPGAWRQIDHELDVIGSLGFAGYFLIVWDIVEFCRRNDIWCQGRGSAANSAVCFAIGVTAADAVRLGLLFERFLSPGRDGPPDIDLDIESGRREEVIQYVYGRYGRTHTAQVANVITYRARSALRDMGRALGHDEGRIDTWTRAVDGRIPLRDGAPDNVPDDVGALARAVEGFPRHLGIHSGGMVICDRPVAEVCPVEWARRADRSVLQWDKDDCAAAGLVKFDLLGLGMLSALHGACDLVNDWARRAGGDDDDRLDLASIPPEDPAVYDMLCAADAVGVFQVESRAQMGTLPRLRPRCFYDLVVEVALIRPGPIQGGSVHPYIRRRNGREPVTYLHPLLRPALERTLGVPLFQEQLMRIAIDVGGFTPVEADELRQAMGSKRSAARMERLRARLYAGMARNGITDDTADVIWRQLKAFANYGFPESHSVSFAHLVYASAWLKCHHPAAMCAALLNAQPMGFWSPQSLVADARRHGVEVRGPDVNASAATATLEPGGDGAPAVRLGLASVRRLGDDTAAAIAAGRPYRDLEDLARRVPLDTAQHEALATAGAYGCFGLDRRAALWAAGAMSQVRDDRLAGVVTGTSAPRLPGMDVTERTAADLATTGISPDRYPTIDVRPALERRGVVPAERLGDVEPGRRVFVAGVVTHRQRPATAQGTIFLNLEDETGLVNVICSPGCWTAHRRVARDAPALVVRGKVERNDGVTNVIADGFEELVLAVRSRSRDFR